MDRLSQLAAAIAIAAGTGLYTFSHHLDPPINLASPTNVRMSFDAGDHRLAAVAGGWGMAFITLGVLGLAIPWINVWVRKQCYVAIGTQ
jgi:hypothetical protein